MTTDELEALEWFIDHHRHHENYELCRSALAKLRDASGPVVGDDIHSALMHCELFFMVLHGENSEHATAARHMLTYIRKALAHYDPPSPTHTAPSGYGKLKLVYDWFIRECAAAPDSGEVVDAGARPAFNAVCELLAAVEGKS